MANNTNSTTLGDAIREARSGAGIRLRKLASDLSLTPTYISDIENDRRVPSEEVLKSIAKKLGLDFDYLMPLAGRFGEKTERYVRQNPTAGVLFRRISESNLQEDDLRRLLDEAERLKLEKEKDSERIP